jgi:deoxyadenosine/deoxycytidine kinase
LPKLKGQIQMRGRDFEKAIPDSYLGNLNRYYDDWMDGYRLGKKLVIESDGLDFVRRTSDFDSIADRIISTLDQRDLFLENSGLRIAHSAPIASTS